MDRCTFCGRRREKICDDCRQIVRTLTENKAGMSSLIRIIRFVARNPDKFSEGMVTAAMVKELREKTGAGMGDCKRALLQSDGDMEDAEEIVREKGLC